MIKSWCNYRGSTSIPVHFQGSKVEIEAGFPDFLVVGAHRSRAASLYMYMKQYPHLFLPYIKEPLFFTFCDQELSNIYKDSLLISETITKIEDHLNLFKNAKENQIKGEISSIYLFFCQTMIKNIIQIGEI